MGVFSKNKIALDLQAISTIITDGAVIEGNLNAPAFARIDGHVKGDVLIDEGLILGEKGVITGQVTTKEMVVYGTVTGNLDVHSLEIRSTGKVNGDIKTASLSVETGAVYNGNLSMTQNYKLAQSNKAAKHAPKELEVEFRAD